VRRSVWNARRGDERNGKRVRKRKRSSGARTGSEKRGSAKREGSGGSGRTRNGLARRRSESESESGILTVTDAMIDTVLGAGAGIVAEIAPGAGQGLGALSQSRRSP
jgi:hypothetical protein